MRKLGANSSLFAYLVSTVFMVFFSVSAIHNWPDQVAQTTIFIICITTILLVCFQYLPNSIPRKNWPKELKLVFIILILGLLNIFFSENGPNYTDYIKVKPNLPKQKSDHDDRTIKKIMVDACEDLFSKKIELNDLEKLSYNIAQKPIVTWREEEGANKKLLKIQMTPPEIKEECRRWETLYQREVKELNIRFSDMHHDIL